MPTSLLTFADVLADVHGDVRVEVSDDDLAEVVADDSLWCGTNLIFCGEDGEFALITQLEGIRNKYFLEPK